MGVKEGERGKGSEGTKRLYPMISIYFSIRADKRITTKDRPRGVSFESNNRTRSSFQRSVLKP